MKVICNKVGTDGICFECGAAKPHESGFCDQCLVVPEAKCVPFNYWKETIKGKEVSAFNLHIEYDYINNCDRVFNLNDYVKMMLKASGVDNKIPVLGFSDVKKRIITLSNLDEHKINFETLIFRIINELVGDE